MSRGSYFVVQAGVELRIFLPLLPDCIHCKYLSPGLALKVFPFLGFICLFSTVPALGLQLSTTTIPGFYTWVLSGGAQIPVSACKVNTVFPAPALGFIVQTNWPLRKVSRKKGRTVKNSVTRQKWEERIKSSRQALATFQVQGQTRLHDCGKKNFATQRSGESCHKCLKSKLS